MESTDRRLTQALADFDKAGDPDALDEALQAIEAAGSGSGAERQVPQQFGRWLRLLAALDRHLDPNWDPDQVPVTGVIAPPSDGKAWFSGVDPGAIGDAEARAQYEREIERTRQHAQRYRVQQELRRLDERAMRSLETLLASEPAHPAASRQQLVDALAAAQLREERRKRIRVLIAAP